MVPRLSRPKQWTPAPFCQSERKNGDLLTWQPEASMPLLHLAERVTTRMRGEKRNRGEAGDKKEGEQREENGKGRKEI